MEAPRKSLILITMAVASLCLTLGACDQLTSVQTRLERAAAALDKGDLSAALADARAAAEKDGGNSQAKLLLARISLKQGDAAGALAEIERAGAQGIVTDALVELKAEAQLAAGRHEEARQTLGARTASTRGQVLLAQALFQSGQQADAGKLLADVLARDPRQPDAMLLQARVQATGGDKTAANQTLDALLEAHPDQSHALQLRGQLATQRGDTRAAIAALEQARKSARAQMSFPEQWSLLAMLAQLKLDTDDVAGAAADIEALRKAAPESPATELLRARLLLVQKDVNGAVVLLQKAVVGSPGDARLRRLLAMALSQQGSREQAINQLTSLLADDPADAMSRRALAEIYLAQGDYPGAERLMRDAPAGSTEDAGSEWLRAAILARSGNGAAALVAMERAAAAQKGNVALQVELARAYLSAGRLADARSLLQQQPGARLGPTGRSLQALTLILGQTPDLAKAAIGGWAAANTDDADAQVVAAQYFQQVGDLAAAQSAYQRARQLAPANIDAALGLADLALRRGDNAAAEAGLREIIQQYPREERGYVALALMLRRQGRAQDAESLLTQSIGASPAVVESRLLLAELAVARKDTALMKSMLSQALKVARDRPAALLRVGDIQLASGDATQALASFDEAARAGSQQAMLRAGAVEASRQQYDLALKRVAQFRKAGGPEAAAEEFRGGVLMAQKKYAEAAVAYGNSLKLRPTSSVVAKVFMARSGAGAAQPESVLKSWLERNAADHPVRLLLADHLLTQNQYSAAAIQYETIAKSAPAPVVLNNLAWTYQQLKDSRAADTARRAYEASGGNNPLITDTYGWILSVNGRNGEALPLLKKAAEALPDRPDVLTHYADALENAGSSAEAATLRARIKRLAGA